MLLIPALPRLQGIGDPWAWGPQVRPAACLSGVIAVLWVSAPCCCHVVQHAAGTLTSLLPSCCDQQHTPHAPLIPPVSANPLYQPSRHARHALVPQVAHSWRTTFDIHASWESVMQLRAGVGQPSATAERSQHVRRRPAIPGCSHQICPSAHLSEPQSETHSTPMQNLDESVGLARFSGPGEWNDLVSRLRPAAHGVGGCA